MGKKTGECTSCDRRFELDAEGNIPAHTKAIVGECSGSNLPAVPLINSKARRKKRREAQRLRQGTSDPVTDALPTADDVPTTQLRRGASSPHVTVFKGGLPGQGASHR
jgi:hypothetical protein